MGEAGIARAAVISIFCAHTSTSVCAGVRACVDRHAVLIAFESKGHARESVADGVRVVLGQCCLHVRVLVGILHGGGRCQVASGGVVGVGLFHDLVRDGDQLAILPVDTSR